LLEEIAHRIKLFAKACPISRLQVLDRLLVMIERLERPFCGGSCRRRSGCDAWGRSGAGLVEKRVPSRSKRALIGLGKDDGQEDIQITDRGEPKPIDREADHAPETDKEDHEPDEGDEQRRSNSTPNPPPVRQHCHRFCLRQQPASAR
jgi:hypothetical protein